MSSDPPEAGSVPGRGTPWLAVACALALAFNLRPVVNAVGPVLPDLRDQTGLSATAAGLLLGLPMLAFALVGLAAPWLAERFGAHRAVVVALIALVAGQLVRAASPGAGALFGGSLVALAGVAVANVVLPGLLRLHFPHRIALMTAAYTTLLTIAAAGTAALTVPFAEATGGGWQAGLALWAAPALLAVVPWWLLARRTGRGPRVAGGRRLPLRAVARTRVGPTLALYFGIQAMLAYVIMGWLPEILTQRGLSAAAAGVQVAVIILVGVPPAAIVTSLFDRIGRPEFVIVALSGCYVGGFVGLILLPTSLVVLCSVLIGLGTAAFPVALTLIGLRSRNPPATTSLSAFTQSVGYTLAATGPVAFGALYELTGSWTLPLVALIVAAAGQAVFGTLAVRAPHVDDDLESQGRDGRGGRPGRRRGRGVTSCSS